MEHDTGGRASGASAPGTPPVIPSPYPRAATIRMKPELLSMRGISERTVREHWKLYERVVAGFNGVRDRVQRPSPLDQPHVASLRRELAASLNAVKQHAIYFSNLGGTGGVPTGVFADVIRRDAGEIDVWLRDVRAAAMAAEGWVFAVIDQDDGRLYVMAGAEDAITWDGTAVLAIDVCEHAYAIDHGADRAPYVEAFFANLDWDDVNARTERALRRFRA